MPGYLARRLRYRSPSRPIGQGIIAERYGNARRLRVRTAKDNLCKLSTRGDSSAPLNPRPGPTSWLHPLAYKRFHVLLNSLFKVLCNFPSQYLFAIGLAVIFSLNRSLPAALGCTFKQPDSNVPWLARSARVRYGPSTRSGQVLFKGTCERAPSEVSAPAPTWHRTARRDRRQAFTLGSSRFTRRYSGNHFCFLFLR